MTPLREPKVEYDVRRNVWVVLEDFPCHPVIVPAGFECDLASVPRVLWPIIAPFELSPAAAVVHDYLYRNGGFGVITRKGADDILAQIMEEEGVPAWKRRAAYSAVRLFGGRAWKEAA